MTTVRTHAIACPFCGETTLDCDHYVGPDEDCAVPVFVFERDAADEITNANAKAAA